MKLSVNFGSSPGMCLGKVPLPPAPISLNEAKSSKNSDSYTLLSENEYSTTAIRKMINAKKKKKNMFKFASVLAMANSPC